jgi:hypothetical protein
MNCVFNGRSGEDIDIKYNICITQDALRLSVADNYIKIIQKTYF